VWLKDIPVATLRPSGSTVAVYYVHTDHVNTPRQVTRPGDNAQLWTWYSDPFGTTAANNNPQGLGTFAYNLRFPGQLFDGQAGLHQNYFRDFDPAVGRYVESDPIGLVGGGANTYAYVAADPLLNLDPFGLDTAYVYDGPTFPLHGNNPFGHSAVATTGMGVRSYGNDTAPLQRGRSAAYDPGARGADQ
jgi:RHS repeat-associated protein